jgi:VWFA-related protein
MRRALVLILAFTLAVAWSIAQQNADDTVLTIDDFPSIVSDVTLVTVPVTVMGPNDQYVSGLEATDFKVFDGDKLQKIESFDVAFLPISMVICVQSSERVEGILPDVKKTAVLFTELVLGEFGEAALVAFDQRVRLMQDFTADTKAIDEGLKKITIGSDASRLSDAVYTGIRMLIRRPQNHRKVIVVISESQENGSDIGLGETLRTAQLHDIMIYPVRLSSLSARLHRTPEMPRDPFPPGVNVRGSTPGGVATPTTQMQARNNVTGNVIPVIIDLVRGVKNLVFNNPLELLAKGTGGDDYSPRTEDGLQESIARIGEDLRSQYLLTYRPNNLNESGIFHHIRVEVPYDSAKVRFRPGYWHGPTPVLTPEETGQPPRRP